jgi:predicted nucleic acid-binding protein
MIYLDRCILIYWLEGAPEYRSPVVEAMRSAGGETFCISHLVRLECLVGPLREGDAERKARFEAQFRELRRLALTKGAFDLAAELRARHRLRTPDALRAACALIHGCHEIWTNDRRLGAIEDRLTIRVMP